MPQLRTNSRFLVCQICNHLVELPNQKQVSVECERCGQKLRDINKRSAEPTLIFTLTALILYIPANIFPFMTIELYGSRNSSTIWSGILSLADGGSWSIALIVFLASMLIPFLKLLTLFYLALTSRNKKHPHFKTKLYQTVEAIGRWSMLDIYLLAVLVAIMKLGPWTHVRPELGSVLFLFVVIFTMIASAYFDPKILWEDVENEKIS